MKRPYAKRLNQPQAMPVARSSRRLPPLAWDDDIGEAIFVRALLAVRDIVPSLAHHPLHELEVLFGDYRLEVLEILNRRR